MMSALVSDSEEGNVVKGNLEERKEKEPVKRFTHVGKKLNKYTMEDKARVIELIEKGHKNCKIVKMTGLPESTVRNFKRQKSKIKASLGAAKKKFCGNANASKRVLTNYSAS